MGTKPKMKFAIVALVASASAIRISQTASLPTCLVRNNLPTANDSTAVTGNCTALPTVLPTCTVRNNLPTANDSTSATPNCTALPTVLPTCAARANSPTANDSTSATPNCTA